MKPKEVEAEVGIIVGRFHASDLHEAHIDLIQSVIDRHPRVFIFLGLSPLKTTFRNPLDFECRKQMILEKFHDINVLYIKDSRDDIIWSKNLDNQIVDVIGPNQTAVLYGSRDSFIKHYFGKFKTIELESERNVSGTELRKQITNKTKASSDFRKGIIHAVGNKYATCFPTVDVVILDKSYNRILLARKADEKLYRFVGGFASPNSPSYESDAKREVAEETHLEIDEITYIGSTLINDWRYVCEVDKIKTMLFVGTYIFGSAIADDDIAETRWFTYESLTKDKIVEEHRPLLEMFTDWFEKNSKNWKIEVNNPKVP